LPRLILEAIASFVIGTIVVGGLLCLIAGTFSYWQAWLAAMTFTLGTSTQVLYLAIKDPALLKRRTDVAPKGESTAQRIFLIAALLGDVLVVIMSALDHRYGWSQVSPVISILGDAMIILSFVLYIVVFRVNTYTASSVQVFEGHKVISTGPYAVVRHPKYVGDIILFAGIPLALGSWWGLLFVLLIIPGLVWRILDEEKLLNKDLPGYSEYTQKVRYRLVPYIW
jgi:protein-S-isoprenylcysteine O-methyltransferase Ste14